MPIHFIRNNFQIICNAKTNLMGIKSNQEHEAHRNNVCSIEEALVGSVSWGARAGAL